MIVTNLQEWKDFKAGNIWKFMQDELESWLDDIHIQMEDSDKRNTLEMFTRLAGNAETVHRVLDYVDVLIEENEANRDEYKDDSERAEFETINKDWGQLP